MDGERDVLKNIVEPRLNEFLLKFFCSVEFVDLRHSVKTDNTKTLREREQAIFNICLEEIDNCVPYFIGMIGHRYGWIPADDGVPCPDISIPDGFPIPKEKLSVTMYEFLQGLFAPTTDSKRCLLFLRSEDSYNNLTEGKRKEIEETGDKKRYVQLLREYLLSKRDATPCVNYTFTPNSDNQNETLLCAELFYNSLLKLLEPEFSKNPENEHSNFIAAQEAFVTKKIRDFAGREKELKDCDNIINETNQLVIYSNISGNDTTEFFCKLYDTIRKRNNAECLFISYRANVEAKFDDIIYHWLKKTITGTSPEKTAQLEEAKGDERKMRFIWRDTIKALNDSGKEVYVFNDALNINDDLFKWSKNLHIHFIISISDNIKSFHGIISCKLGAYDTDTLQRITATLRPEVRKALLNKKNASNPKWIKIAISLIDRMTKSDFAQIRARSEKDNEEKIWRYQVALVENMPDDTDDLLLNKIDKLKSLVDSDFVDRYLMLTSLALSVYEQKIFNQEKKGPLQAQIFEPHLGWDENYLAQILETEQSDIIALRQMLGTEIICKTAEGLWNLADSDLHEWIASNYNINKFRPLLQKAYSFIRELPDTDIIAAQVKFKLALINGDVEYCADIIQQDSKQDTAFKHLSHRSLWWFATTYEQKFKSTLQAILNIQNHWNYVFFYNLLHWLPILKNQTQYYLLLIETIIINIRSLWIEKKIDLGTYSSIAEAYGAKIETYCSTREYNKMHECLEYCIQLSKEYCAQNPNFLHLYHFSIWRMTSFFESKERLSPFLESTIIHDERTSKYSYPPDFDTTEYSILLLKAATNMAFKGKTSDAEPLTTKAYDLFFHTARRLNSTRTTLSHIDILANIVVSLIDTIKLHYHFGLLKRETLLQIVEKTTQYFQTVEEQDRSIKHDLTGELYFISYAQSLFLQDGSLHKKTNDLYNFQEEILYKYFELEEEDEETRNDIDAFIYLLLIGGNTQLNIWFTCQSLLLYLMSEDPSYELENRGTYYYLDDGSLGETNRRTFKAMQHHALDILYAETKMTNHQLNESFARNALIVFIAMLRGEWAQFDPDIQRMVQLYNSCNELLDALQNSEIYPQAFENELNNYRDIIEREISKPEYYGIDTSATFDLEQWHETYSPHKNIEYGYTE